MISAQADVSALPLTSPPRREPAPTWSLRNRLMLLATGATLVSWPAGGVAGYLPRRFFVASLVVLLSIYWTAFRRATRALHVALQKLTVSVDRASRMVDQLLTLRAWTGSPRRTQPTLRSALRKSRATQIDELEPTLNECKIRIAADLKPAPLVGMELGVAILLRNLIDNAARHSPAGGEIRVTTGQSQDGQSYAVVEDAGPGIPAAERQQVFGLFYRVAGSASGGCGIGLTIVHCVAQVHQAEITLGDSSLGGLRVVAYFPATTH